MGAVELGVWIVGVPGSGKSTVAADLAQKLAGHHIELDSLFWQPEWQSRSESSFRALVEAELNDHPVWVVDGSFPAAVDGFVERAGCVVWLDPPLMRSWTRLVRRTLRRLRTGESICGGNRESLTSVFGSGSIIIFALKEHARQRRAYAAVFASLQGTDARLIRWRSADHAELVNHLSHILRDNIDPKRSHQ